MVFGSAGRNDSPRPSQNAWNIAPSAFCARRVFAEYAPSAIPCHSRRRSNGVDRRLRRRCHRKRFRPPVGRFHLLYSTTQRHHTCDNCHYRRLQSVTFFIRRIPRARGVPWNYSANIYHNMSLNVQIYWPINGCGESFVTRPKGLLCVIIFTRYDGLMKSYSVRFVLNRHNLQRQCRSADIAGKSCSLGDPL